MGILVIFGIIILAALFSDSPSGSGGDFNDSGGFGSSSSNNNYKSSASKRGSCEQFEEDDSFYDRDGFEHIIDEDRYCEDCDDYHDDY